MFAELQRPVDCFPRVIWRSGQDERHIVTWCSNDYLGMSHHPVVRRAMHDAIEMGATGAGGTRNISGTHCAHVQLETTLASLHNAPAALTFTSGYVANLTTLATLGQLLPGLVILSDAGNHNSMIEGIRRSGAQKIIFKHNDVDDLARALRELPVEQPKVIAFESIYSMNGAVAPVDAIVELAQRYVALTYLDEVHAVGMYGSQGGGIAQALGVESHVDIVQGTLGKAFGLQGGYIVANRPIIDCIRSYGAGFIFSTSLAPVLAAGAQASVKHLMRSDVERCRQRQQVTRLKDALSDAGIDFLDNSSHIVPIMIGDATHAQRITNQLMAQHGHYAQPINYPTVPRGTERIRLTPGPFHTDDMITDFVNALSHVLRNVA